MGNEFVEMFKLMGIEEDDEAKAMQTEKKRMISE
jgi:hypothetical protein